MADEPRPSVLNPPNRVLLAGLAALPLGVLLLTLLQPGYGYFIDEFYYIACAKRLAWGYVDHPPLAPALLAVTRTVLGDSVLAIRLAAFLGMSATVWVTGLIVRRLGGGTLATVVAGLGIGLSPVLLVMSSFYSMNAFEPLLWSLTVLVLITLIQDDRPRLWLVAGALIGLAFENKHTVILYVAALAAGVSLTRTRRVLASGWLWAGIGVAILLAVPNILWQVFHGWPSIEFYRNAQLLKNVPSTPSQSLVMQVLVTNPIAAPIWIAGLVYLFVHRDARNLRFLGLLFVVLLALHVVSRTSRPDRIASAYPVLLAAGAVAFERGVSLLRARHAATARALAIGWPALMLASSAVILPGALPLLPPPTEARYTQALGLTRQAERGKSAPLPQLIADRTGWESFVDDMARAYRELPEADRAKAVFYAPSYGQGGALELLGPSRGLPNRVIASQNTYWHWSVGRTNTDVLIAVDVDPNALRQLFAEVREVGRVRCDYCMNWRNNVSIYVARRSIVPIDTVWAGARHYE
jgi:hypothetical protein